MNSSQRKRIEKRAQRKRRNKPYSGARQPAEVKVNPYKEKNSPDSLMLQL